jgi:hypothetical protein
MDTLTNNHQDPLQDHGIGTPWTGAMITVGPGGEKRAPNGGRIFSAVVHDSKSSQSIVIPSFLEGNCAKEVVDDVPRIREKRKSELLQSNTLEEGPCPARKSRRQSM